MAYMVADVLGALELGAIAIVAVVAIVAIVRITRGKDDDQSGTH